MQVDFFGDREITTTAYVCTLLFSGITIYYLMSSFIDSIDIITDDDDSETESVELEDIKKIVMRVNKFKGLSNKSFVDYDRGYSSTPEVETDGYDLEDIIFSETDDGDYVDNIRFISKMDMDDLPDSEDYDYIHVNHE